MSYIHVPVFVIMDIGMMSEGRSEGVKVGGESGRKVGGVRVVRWEE